MIDAKMVFVIDFFGMVGRTNWGSAAQAPWLFDGDYYLLLLASVTTVGVCHTPGLHIIIIINNK